MGLFTYRQTKKTKREVQGLRQQQAAQAVQAAVDRDTALFQQLPPEGKKEFRELDAEFRSLSAWQIRRRDELVRARDELFRRYDLIP
jgi:hypothetical protein